MHIQIITSETPMLHRVGRNGTFRKAFPLSKNRQKTLGRVTPLTPTQNLLIWRTRPMGTHPIFIELLPKGEFS